MSSRNSALMLLQEKLEYRFKDIALLQRALTHRSFCQQHNERLEFLGDGMLNFAVADLLYRRFPESDEGRLSRMRSHLVRQDCLARLGADLNLSDLLSLGEGEKKSGGARRASMLADAFESLVGAIYLDGGFEKAFAIVSRLIEPILEQTGPEALGKDPKTQLQEHLQGARLTLPVYKVLVEGGSAQSSQFEVVCELQSFDLQTRGVGCSRRAAEQAAAQAALALIHTQTSGV